MPADISPAEEKFVSRTKGCIMQTSRGPKISRLLLQLIHKMKALLNR